MPLTVSLISPLFALMPLTVSLISPLFALMPLTISLIPLTLSFEYLFLFDSGELWGRLEDFEKDLAKFLNQYGLEAESIKIAGQKGRKLLLINKKQGIQPLGVNDMPGRKK